MRPEAHRFQAHLAEVISTPGIDRNSGGGFRLESAAFFLAPLRHVGGACRPIVGVMPSNNVLPSSQEPVGASAAPLRSGWRQIIVS